MRFAQPFPRCVDTLAPLLTACIIWSADAFVCPIAITIPSLVHNLMNSIAPSISGARAEGGQSGLRDDATTGSLPLRDTLERHLRPVDIPASKRGPRGMVGRMIEKAERFAPGAGKKHRAQADSDYAASLAAGNTERPASPAPASPIHDEGGD